MEIKVEQDNIKAHIIAQNPQAQEMIDRHPPRLREALELQGLNLQQIPGDPGRRRPHRQPALPRQPEPPPALPGPADRDPAVVPGPVRTGDGTTATTPAAGLNVVA